MALNNTLKLTEGNKTPVDEGSHLSVLQSIVHVGVQRSEHKGTVSYKDTVLLTFEIQDVDSDKPVLRTKRATTKMGSEHSTLVILGTAMLGKAAIQEGIKFSSMIGKPVMTNFSKTEKGSTSITGFSAVPKGLLPTVKPLINEPQLLLDVDEISEKELATLPEFVRKMINERITDTPSSPSDDDVSY